MGKKVVENVICIKDPDGYTFEVSEAAYRRDPVSKVSLLVLDMEKSINFYQDVSVVCRAVTFFSNRGSMFVFVRNKPLCCT